MTEVHKELSFWQNHREYVQNLYNQNQSESNLIWLNNIDKRIQDMVNNPNGKIEKPKFGETTKKGKK